MPPETFSQYVFNPDRLVGAKCSHGTWFKDWRANALAPGNYYADNGNSLILIQTQYMGPNQRDSSATVPSYYVGYFYNPAD